MKCKWSTINHSMEIYHDNEWGIPCHDEKKLFEKLILEGQQSGLSWNTILQKRDGYRNAFYDFDAEKIAEFSENNIIKLMQNTEIIRYDKKILSIINNSKAYLQMQKNGETLDNFFWKYINFIPIINNIEHEKDILIKSDLSMQISKDLKKKGFSYVGPITIYSFMEAAGMIDDHLNSCPCKKRN